MPVAAAVAIATLVGLLITRDRRRIPLTPATVVLILFMGWMSLTTATAFYKPESAAMLDRVLKIDLMVLVTLAVLFTRRHIELFVWVNVISLGFYGVKVGIFTLASGGAFLVWGPPLSFIEGNNELALALIMIIPLMRYLQIVATNRWIRHGSTFAMPLCAVAALGSYSRGALLAIVALVAFFWFRLTLKVFS